MAGLGYSAESGMRWEIVQFAQRTASPDDEKVLKNSESGSVRRLILHLEAKKLIERITVISGQSKIIINVLTDLGKEVAQAMGVTLVESEWERLMRLHGGELQQKHAAQVCLFTSYARRRGWTTRVCPEAQPPADPDVLIEKDGQRIYVEVEAGSGSVERRMKKWRNMRNMQGFVAICAPTAAMRQTLVAEARSNTKKGMATDFGWLRQNDDEPQKGLWAQKWGYKSNRKKHRRKQP